MLYTIDEIKTKLHPIFEEKGVIKAVLFGSYAKGEATEESDIDIAALFVAYFCHYTAVFAS